ncbi:type II toxin-antitoxin system PemK/MazF family toxin [Dactylosporangium sp. AC04546]|uniref:type II toxin-antitoxin system PemK/MazF family toxin n=1 Tax=Dactylosporangium sp. AC04546 TaxID=2862460 RepID=UPI001EE015D8|nr:type II toxin-antitoxin system PemK/MazF family toxin [Dactylosporangium sp. AC04546]WVK84500.1 type II toxin-antitoxin system PemK/MazF family toxin [Dactylosporangium sp. AC04546]
MVVRGQVWTYLVGSWQYRVVIISNDEFNEFENVHPWALVVDRTAGGSDLTVPLGPDDPLPGAAVNVAVVLRVDRTGLRHNHGYLSNDTMNLLEDALRDFLNLP